MICFHGESLMHLLPWWDFLGILYVALWLGQYTTLYVISDSKIMPENRKTTMLKMNFSSRFFRKCSRPKHLVFPWNVTSNSAVATNRDDMFTRRHQASRNLIKCKQNCLQNLRAHDEEKFLLCGVGPLLSAGDHRWLCWCLLKRKARAHIPWESIPVRSAL